MMIAALATALLIGFLTGPAAAHDAPGPAPLACGGECDLDRVSPGDAGRSDHAAPAPHCSASHAGALPVCPMQAGRPAGRVFARSGDVAAPSRSVPPEPFPPQSRFGSDRS